MLSEEVYLERFSKDWLAAMSQEQFEDALAWAKQRVIEFDEAEKERERQFREEGILIHVSVFERICRWDVMFYETEELRKRRALNEDRITLLKELRQVKRERGYDREKFPDMREIVLSELLLENGGECLADRPVTQPNLVAISAY